MLLLVAVLGTAAVLPLGLLIYARRDWNCLRLRLGHLGIWLTVGFTAIGINIWTCLQYNVVAGTDLTKAEIAKVAVATLAGTLAGPVANPGAGAEEANVALWKGAELLFFVAISLIPFVLVRRPVSTFPALFAWCGFAVACILWNLGAIISLAVFLS